MSEKKATKPKFVTDLKINPEKITRPITKDSPWKLIEFTATVYTSGTSKIPIDFTVTHPENNEEHLIERSVGESGQDTANASMTYAISHDDATGTYAVKAKIRNCENERCEIGSSFQVDKDPREV